MSRYIENLVTGSLVLCAIAIAAVAVHREFADPTPSARRPEIVPPVYIQNWETFSSVGTWIGDSTAKVRIVEFTDYECPFCRRFHEHVRELQQSMKAEFSLLVIPFPLPGHRFARPAALAAECAGRQGRWGTFHDALFAKQDSFGLKSWISYAKEAGIRDTMTFASCAAMRTHSDKIDSAVALGNRLKLTGTPTVIINGWRYSEPPLDSLRAIVTTRRDAR
jgi:protein-disulfide isomerase